MTGFYCHSEAEGRRIPGVSRNSAVRWCTKQRHKETATGSFTPLRYVQDDIIKINNMIKKLLKKLIPKTFSAFVFMFFVGLGMFLGIYFAVSFTEPISDNSGFVEPENVRSEGDWHAYGRGWEPNASGSGSTELSSSTCAAAHGWYWFEDGNGDGDFIDEEDGICVKATTTITASTPGVDTWAGSDCDKDSTYIAAYTCAGNFPNGYVATYSGFSGCTTDTTYNYGDCAVCQADCYDGKKDLPDQGGYTAESDDKSGGGEGPLQPEVLKNWTGTRLPTLNDFFGFCGYKNGSKDYATGCSSDTTHGSYGGMVGRTDECIDASEYDASSGVNWEWLTCNGRGTGGCRACSMTYIDDADNSNRFRAVFRP